MLFCVICLITSWFPCPDVQRLIFINVVYYFLFNNLPSVFVCVVMTSMYMQISALLSEVTLSTVGKYFLVCPLIVYLQVPHLFLDVGYVYECKLLHRMSALFCSCWNHALKAFLNIVMKVFIIFIFGW